MTQAQHKALKAHIRGFSLTKRQSTMLDNLNLKPCPFKYSYHFDTDIRKEMYLQKAVFECASLYSKMAVHIPNEGKRKTSTGNHLKKQGFRTGFPDLIIPDLMIAVELKTRFNTPSESQIEWLQMFRDIGWRSFWVDSLDEFKMLVNDARG